MWELIIPMLLVERIQGLKWALDKWERNEEEGAEDLMLGSIDITWLGQYMVLVTKGDKKYVNQCQVFSGKKMLPLVDWYCLI